MRRYCVLLLTRRASSPQAISVFQERRIGIEEKDDCVSWAGAFLGEPVSYLDELADPAVGIEHHRPVELGDLRGPQTGFDG
jgi:hypothetical protein